MRLQLASKWIPLSVLCLLLGLSGCREATSVPFTPAALPTPAQVSLVAPSPVALAAQEGGYATSVDERGVPRFLISTGQRVAPAALSGSADQAARFHVGRFFAAQGVDATALAIARTVAVRDLGRDGKLVHLRQELDGLEVYAGDVKVLLKQDNELVALSGSLRRPTARRASYRLTAQEALAVALGDQLGVLVPSTDVRDLVQRQGPWELFELDARATVSMSGPAHLKRVYYPQGNELAQAWVVEFEAQLPQTDAAQTLRLIVAADDGRVLERANFSASEAFSYRVWADATDKRPADGPSADYTPHPTGVPNGFRPPFVAPSLVVMEGFNRNPMGLPDPWLPATATETVGNNVDAYGDPQLPDGFTNGDLRATLTTGTRTFDRLYDLNLEPLSGTAINPAQLMAATTNAFYVSNWLHDYWYNVGFDEAAGNNQFDNFGRGGLGGDRMNIEVQDRALAGQRNNANMATPSDGFPPKMQIFLWSGYSTRTLATSLSATPLASGLAAFGPSNFNITGTLVLADDGTGVVSDACTPLVNNVTGRVVLVDRGACTFKTKTLNAQNGGAIGVLMADNAVRAAPPAMADDATITTPITIGTFSVFQATGTALKAGLVAGVVTVNPMNRITAAEADGSLDNTTLAHEYGHFWHHRLQDCTTDQCRAMSEGWGDFVALHFMLRDGDNLDGTFSDSTYASMGSSADGAYFGIRRFPYSSDLTKSPLTFRFVADQGATMPVGIPVNPNGSGLSEVHNAGEIWASTLFDSYIALQRARAGTQTFDDVRNRFARDLTTALQLAPRDSTYTEMRDAILATISARSSADSLLVAQAFARRGMGTCAVSPPRAAVAGTITGLTETFTLSPSLTLGAVTLDDGVRSCDGDGVLDAEERGRLTLSLGNAGPQAATATTFTLVSTTAGVTLPNGGVVTVANIPPYSTVPVTVDVELAANLTLATNVTFTVTVDNAGSCTPQLTTQVLARLNTDERPATTATDDVESATVWTLTGGSAADIWAREVDVAPNHVWHGIDLGALSDTSLVSPDLRVAATGNFVVTFNHKYSFEYGDDGTGTLVGWDGAVIEVSENGGQTWADVTTYGIAPGYGGTLFNVVNPLGITRQVFLNQNASYPATDAVTLDFGTQLAGKTVRLRFRIGTDAAAGAFGWQLDDLVFTGTTNTPFTALLADTSICGRAPVAVAGAAQTVRRGATVRLDASGSTDANSDPLTFTWSQTAGPSVTLVTTSGVVTSFVAPAVAVDTVLTFRVIASDGTLTGSATVDITVSGNRAPVANAGSALSVNSGGLGVLNGNASSDPDGDALTYTWSQLTGSTAVLGGTSTATISFTAPVVTADELLTFELLVSDGTASSTASVTVTVVAPPVPLANRPPVAPAAAQLTVASGQIGVLDASTATDPDGDVLTFAWSQTAGPTATLRSATGVITTFTAPTVTTDTTLTFQLSVSDGNLSATSSVTVTVTAPPLPAVNVAPTAAAGDDVSVKSGEAVFLNGNASTDPEGRKLTYAWTQTAGEPSVTLADAQSALTGFTAPGLEAQASLVFELKVTDDAGLSSTDSVTVTIEPQPKVKTGCSVSGGPLGLLLLGALLRRRRVA